MLDLDEVQISSQGHHKLKMGTPIRKDDIIFKTTIKSKFTIITCNEVDNLDEDGDVLAILSIDDIKNTSLKIHHQEISTETTINCCTLRLETKSEMSYQL